MRIILINDNEDRIEFLKINNDELEKNNQHLLQVLEQQSKQLTTVHFVDDITGLGNMNKFKFDLDEEKFNSIALYDIKDLRLVNNLYGKSIGSEVLKKLTEIMHNYAILNHLNVYIINSDSIAATLSEQMSDTQFVEIIYNLQEILNKSNYGHDIYINTRVGVVIRQHKLLQKAMLVLDYIKNNKGDRAIYSAELKLEENIEKNLMWINKIKKAIKADRIIPYFQPIYNNSLGEYDKFEALIRLKDEQGNIVGPAEFLDIAKKAKLYRKLTEIMITKTFNAFLNKNYGFSINLTVDDILDPKMRDFILRKLESFPNSSNVIFEIVETEGIQNFVEVKAFIDEVKKYGAKIAIDDFGTGYSNLLYLTKLNIDILKIDGSIIKKIGYDKSSWFVAKTILYLTKGMNIKTVAEYVENEEIYNEVKGLEMDYSQGYYFSKPICYEQLFG